MATLTQKPVKLFIVCISSTKKFVECESDYPELVLSSNYERMDVSVMAHSEKEIPQWLTEFNRTDDSYGYPSNGGEKEKIIWKLDSVHELNLDDPLEF